MKSFVKEKKKTNLRDSKQIASLLPLKKHCKNENVNTKTVHTIRNRYSQFLLLVAFGLQPFSLCPQAPDWVNLSNTITDYKAHS